MVGGIDVRGLRSAAPETSAPDGRPRAAVLVVDKDADVRTALATSVRRHGDAVATVADHATALRALAQQQFDVVFADVRGAGRGDLAMLHEVRRHRPEATVVLMTAHGTIAEAVHAMQAGAYDYLVKPLAPEQVQRLLDRILGVKAMSRDDPSPGEVVEALRMLESANPLMRRAIATARQVAPSDAAVLLTGESGTGKNVLARAIHAWSGHRSAPFMTIPCAALSDHRHGGALLGHLRGASSGAGTDTPGPLEAAWGGTLFLDEVGDLPRELQGSVLRLLTGEGFESIGAPEPARADVRVIAATHHDLEAEVAAGHFRDDLFFRLNVVTIALPPLRERSQDLAALTDHVLARLATRYRRGAVRISPQVRRLLAAYRWPGNTRELVNVLERAVILSQGDTITPDHLPDCLLARAPRAPASTPTHRLSLEELERQHIERVLADSGTLEEAATRLGINPTTLWRKRRRYRLAAVAPPGAAPPRHRRPRPTLPAGTPGTGGPVE
jgi:NtrC-family two-component system response regulator AlgB